MEKAYELLAAKTISISKLMLLVPPGTIDPTPHLYDTTMYTLSGLMAVAVVAHGLVKPVSTKVIDVVAENVASKENEVSKEKESAIKNEK